MFAMDELRICVCSTGERGKIARTNQINQTINANQFMTKSDTTAKLFTARTKAQGEFKPVGFDAQNAFLKNKYATLGAIIEAHRATLAKHGLSIVQMPAGIPVHTFAIGRAGAINAALGAAAILALGDAALARRLDAYRAKQTKAVLDNPIPGRKVKRR